MEVPVRVCTYTGGLQERIPALPVIPTVFITKTSKPWTALNGSEATNAGAARRVRAVDTPVPWTEPTVAACARVMSVLLICTAVTSC